MSRQLIRQEGLLVGGSCGGNVYCAVEEARSLPAGARVVVILPDSVRNYMTKYLSDDWMIEQGFLNPSEADELSLQWWHKLPVSVISMKDPIIISPSMKCQTAMEIMNDRNVDQLPVVDNDGSISGAVTLHNMMRKVTKGKAAAQDPVSKVMYNQFQKVTVDTPLSVVSKMLDHDHFVIVTKGWQYYADDGTPKPRDMYIGTVTAAHLLSHIITGPPQLNGVSDDETLGSDVDSLKSCDIDVTLSWRHQIPANNDEGEYLEKQIVFGIVSRSDIVHYIMTATCEEPIANGELLTNGFH